MPASRRPPGYTARARAQQVAPEFRPTMGWVQVRTGGLWWRIPLAALTLVVVTFVLFYAFVLAAEVARKIGAAEGPLTLLRWVGFGISLAAGAFAAVIVARPPLRWVTREQLMPVKSDLQRRLEAGAEGEFITGEYLRPFEAEGYEVRHSIDIPGEERPIDHVVIGPTGLFVIESKYYLEDVRPVGDRLFGEATPLDRQVALLRHQCDEMWRRVSRQAGVSVRGVFSMVGNQLTPAFALDPALWCSPGRELGVVLRAWEPRRLEPELVQWLAARVDEVFETGGEVEGPVPASPPLHRVLEGSPCDRKGCSGVRELRHREGGPYLVCSERDQGRCDRSWTLDGALLGSVTT